MKTTDPNQVLIFDTTLRDGEQCPGASMNLREKLQVAEQLTRLNVDIIEAGFPIASPGDFEAVHKIATDLGQGDGPQIAGLARCVEKDIRRAGDAVAPAGGRGRIHVFLATSAIHRQFKLKKAKEEIIKAAVEGVRLAKTYVDDVQFSPEDASRTEHDFLAEVVQAVIEAGATTVNIPDTVGYAVPQEFADTIAMLKSTVPNIDQAIIHVHCHNDLGLAVANSLAAVKAGARGIECTINGIGERAGNCSLEEVVMAMRTRADFYGELKTGIHSEEIYRASRLVTQLTGMIVQRNKAIVGANAFAHEAGIHQDGYLKERTTYEIMRPEDVGITGTELVLGKHSGRHAFRDHMEKLGFNLDDEQLQKAYDTFIDLADKKKHIYDDDLVSIMQDLLGRGKNYTYTLEHLQVSTGRGLLPTATVRITKGDETSEDAATGDGPIDACIACIQRITGIDHGKLTDFTLQALTKGKDAIGEVSLQVDFGDFVLTGKGSSTDIIEAGAKAYLNVINRYLAAKDRHATRVEDKKGV